MESSPQETNQVRIGAVSYLNARPLVYGLPGFAPEADVVVDLPSRLADGLRAGRFDVALVPSIEYFRIPGATIASDACIACDGPVRSVKLYSRVPLEQVRTLALDEGSRTSAALARILLKERLKLEPALEQLAIGNSVEDSSADAVVLIGDRAMRSPVEEFRTIWDLGDEWSRWTGLPFVFALWVVRPGANLGKTSEALASARDEGARHLDQIARWEAPVLGLPEADCRTYLCEQLRFHLGVRERQGLEAFYRLAVQHGLAPAGVELAFYDHRDSR